MLSLEKVGQAKELDEKRNEIAYYIITFFL